MKKKLAGIIICMLLIVAFIPAVQAETKDKNVNNRNWYELAKLMASDGAVLSFFGSSLSMDGDYAIIGAHGVTDNGPYSGAAYIFKRDGSTWSEQVKLLASDGVMNDMFGHSVSMDGDYAIVGAPAADGPGYAYIFKNTGTTWTEQQKLTASDGEIWDEFGYSVAMDGEYAIIGAQFDDDIGSAYIFKRDGTTWTEQQKLTASDGDLWDCYGMSAAIDGEYAVFGGWGDEDYTGSAYVFKREGTTWTEQQKLTASDGLPGDRLGVSVAIDGEYIIVGSIHDDSSKGAAYIFKRDGTTWTEQQKLTASDGASGDGFGVSVPIDGDCIIVGAYQDADNGVYSGSAYVFELEGTTWTEKQKLLASDGAPHDEFGFSISIDGEFALIGAYSEDDYIGSAYVFGTHRPPTPPEIDGPPEGGAGVELCWTFHSDDPDGDSIKYIIDWGDGNTEETDCEEPCTPVEACHTYETRGTYIISAKAQECPDGLESDESTFEVSIPRIRAVHYSLFLLLLERFPNMFPMLRYILGLQ